MEEVNLVVHEPEDGETLRHYLQRYTPEERQRIYQHKIKSTEFCAVLVKNRWPREVQEESIEKSLENLWKILERLNNFRRLLHFIELLEPVRRELLDSLDNYADVIGKISKWCAGGRILGSAVDAAGTVGGLYLVDAKPSSDNWALGMATFFGLLGVACSLSEVKISSDAFNYLMERIHIDQKYLAPIQSWYQQSSELEAEMLNIFPFDMTNKIVKEFIETGEDRQRLLSKLLTAVENFIYAKKSVKRNGERLDENAVQKSSNTDEKGTETEGKKDDDDDDERLIEKLIRFVLSEQAKEVCLSLFVRQRHPIFFDIAKMALQIKYSSWPFYVCQSVAALAPRNRHAYSIPVLGRTVLNLLSIYDGVLSIGRSTRHEIEIRQLKKQLECEMIALKKISVFIQMRTGGLIL